MKNQEITTLIGQKRAYNSSSFLLRVGENMESSPKNIAILASKKNFKTAVLRNTVRRLIKNAVNKVIIEISDSKKTTIKEIKALFNRYSLVFSPKKGFEKIVFSDLVEEIKQSLIKNGII
ncbi:MAG: Ribonuclease [Patescibacteria group bacterium]|nr:Ribonuclease [Patescibacteria group bacterium]